MLLKADDDRRHAVTVPDRAEYPVTKPAHTTLYKHHILPKGIKGNVHTS